MPKYREIINSKPFSEQEVDNLKDVFRSLPTWDGNQIKTTDYPELIAKMKFERTSEQIAAYQKYWDDKHGGKLTLDQFIDSAKSLHNTTHFVEEYIKLIGEDEYIDPHEFKDLLKMIEQHSPEFKSSGMTYEDFVKVANKNKDGRVDKAECVKWLKKVLKN